MQQSFIVFDHNIPEFWQNRILDRAHMSQFPGATALTDLAEAAQKAGYQVMTADMFLSQPAPSGPGLVLTEIITPHTDELLRHGLIPAVCTCAESPIIAYHFYHHIARYAGRYEHAFLFGGACERLRGTGARFHPFFWPSPSREVFPGGPAWSQRRFMTLINSNKRAFQFNLLGPIRPRYPRRSLWYLRQFVRQHGQDLLIRYFDPWMRSELYLERLRAIEHFSRHPQFDLYGFGWDQPVQEVNRKFQQRFQAIVQRCYRGTIPGGTENKWRALQNYRFAVCFENTTFRGYITEKLLDCFLAGSIPVYYGAPDIHDHVPRETFIDFRDFRSYEALERYLLTLTEIDAKRYLEAAQDFLASESFDKFHVSGFVRRTMAALDDVLERYA